MHIPKNINRFIKIGGIFIATTFGILFLHSCSSIETETDTKIDNKQASQKNQTARTQGKIDRSVKTTKIQPKANALKEAKEVKKNEAPDAVALADAEKWIWPTETEAQLKPHTEAKALDLKRPLVESFISKMIQQHGFSRSYIENILASANNKPSILKIMSRPAEKSKEWYEYRPIFLTEKRIKNGKIFLEENAVTLQAAESKYGVPKEIIAAIIGVETFYGRNSGKHKVIDSLVTLGFNYPPRAKFFRRELEQFFLLSREEGFDPKQVLGSYAGAMGNGQFISSSYRNFTTDGDGDGKRDLWNSWPDAIHSVANYFKVHKWHAGEEVLAIANVDTTCSQNPSALPESIVTNDKHTIASLKNNACKISFTTKLPEDSIAMFLTMQQENSTDYLVGFNNFYTITRYNRSPMYARAVHQLSQALVTNEN